MKEITIACIILFAIMAGIELAELNNQPNGEKDISAALGWLCATLWAFNYLLSAM